MLSTISSKYFISYISAFLIVRKCPLNILERRVAFGDIVGALVTVKSSGHDYSQSWEIVPLILPNCGGDFQNYIHDLQ
jgi:hypothetical protein